MTPLSEEELREFIFAVRGEKFNIKNFDNATKKLRRGYGATPDGLDRNLPYLYKEWRKDEEWSIDFANRHQLACESSRMEYWRIILSEDENLMR